MNGNSENNIGILFFKLRALGLRMDGSYANRFRSHGLIQQYKEKITIKNLKEND